MTLTDSDFEDYLKNLRNHGWIVSDVRREDQRYKNKHTDAVCKAICSYSLADRERSYGRLLLLDNGSPWRENDLRDHWEQL